MKKLFGLILSLIVVVALALPNAAPVSADDIPGSISGKVFDSDGTTALGGATVTVYNVTSGPTTFWSPTTSATTRSDGTYTIAGLTLGNYVVTACAGGHQRNFQHNLVGWFEFPIVGGILR